MAATLARTTFVTSRQHEFFAEKCCGWSGAGLRRRRSNVLSRTGKVTPITGGQLCLKSLAEVRCPAE
jgi:hypothetical protein